MSYINPIEKSFDINSDAKSGLVGIITNIDALLLCVILNIQPYEAGPALKEFRRDLKDGGFAVITCPDLRSICALVANDLLVEPSYMSTSGPISLIDILYGHRPALQVGNHYMAHHCGFTERVMGTLQQTGLPQIASFTRPECFDIWALATC